eukprot:jgi/Chrzof1/10769/Cz05g11160.t1
MACCAAEQQPGLFHDVVLGPLVCSDALQPVQSQLIVKVLKEVVAAHIRAKVLQSLTVPWLAFNQTATRAQNLTAMPVWLEPHLSILQGIIDTKMELSQDSLACLLSAMECAVSRSPQLASSVKFVQLMMTTMTTYAAALTPTHVNDMLRLATRTKTFLTKPLISKLNKLHS